jgi:choline dehydrogenase
VETDQEILDWVAKDSETALHPSCTCRLGVGEDAVIDPLSMKVHGLEGVRVIDASAMRYVTNGNIYAPTMMLAEKSADLIMGNTPLAAISEPFYVHQMAEGSAARYGRDGGAESSSAGDAGAPAEAAASAEAAPAE